MYYIIIGYIQFKQVLMVHTFSI